MFSFKRADISEIPEIQRIADETWPKAYEDIIGKGQVSYMLNLIYSTNALQQQFRDGHYFYFIYYKDELAGFTSFGEVKKFVWKLFKLYVLPSAQGNGSGKNLLNFSIKKMVSLGACQVILNVNRYNKARFFYAKNGFAIAGTEDIDIGNGYFMNDYIMEMVLCNEE